MNTANEENIRSAAEFGAELRRQRESKQLSIGEVAERLKLPVRQIEALESGSYESLPEPVFVRGFLRSYARFLDLDEARINSALEQIIPAPKTQYAAVNSSSLSYANTEVKKPFPTWIFGLGAAIVIGAGIYAWQTKSGSEHAKQENAEISGSEVAAPNLNNANIAVKPMEASAAAPAAAAASDAAVAGELVINTRYRTMLTVTNAKGEVLINQIVPGRSEHRFREGAPFEVSIGYAIGSTATFGGEAINLDAKRQGRKTAKFTTAPIQAASAAQ